MNQNAQIQESQSATQVPPEQISKSHNWYKITTFVLLLLILIAGIYWVSIATNLLSNHFTSPDMVVPTGSPIVHNDSRCEKDTDCKLIYSNCDCESVLSTDSRTKSDKDSDKVCKLNQCTGYEIKAQPRCVNQQCVVDYNPSTTEQTPTNQELFAIVSQYKSELLKGVAAVDLKYNNAKNIGTDLYMVEFSYVQQDGTILPSGGGNVLVGKENGQWTVPLGEGNPLFCKWVSASNLPEADKGYLQSNNACH